MPSAMVRPLSNPSALWQSAMSSPVDDVKTPASVSQPHRVAACSVGTLRNQGMDVHLRSWNTGVVERREQSARATQCCSSAVRAQIIRVNRLQFPGVQLAIYIGSSQLHRQQLRSLVLRLIHYESRAYSGHRSHAVRCNSHSSHTNSTLERNGPRGASTENPVP